MGIPILNQGFVIWRGFALNFSDRAFVEFFREELHVNSDNPRWGDQGERKARRVRYFLGRADRHTALDTLNALWKCRDISGDTNDYPAFEDSVAESCSTITPAQCN